uniref:Uncharacterized protein C18orf19 homolog A n=1 Tax=Phallusia mammillata TaxID=59560 RepID=A0A6F9DBR5_9ASCI|nr:uncharacterized protein C18orf19 homolog A [Phallusia mammillata]
MVTQVAKFSKAFAYCAREPRIIVQYALRTNFRQSVLQLNLNSTLLKPVCNGTFYHTKVHLPQRVAGTLPLQSQTHCLKLFHTRNHEKSIKTENNEDTDDLQAILKNRSLGITAKFKVLFRQYGVVMAGVHVVTSACWVALIYFSLQRGIDIIPFMESIGVFDFLDKIGLSYAEKLKSSSASVWLMTYLVYELGKPIRYPVTLAGTVYAVRHLRKIGYFKPPPKSATVGQLVETQSKILQQRIHDTGVKYSEQYRKRSSKPNKSKNGHKRLSKKSKSEKD